MASGEKKYPEYAGIVGKKEAMGIQKSYLVDLEGLHTTASTMMTNMVLKTRESCDNSGFEDVAAQNV